MRTCLAKVYLFFVQEKAQKFAKDYVFILILSNE